MKLRPQAADAETHEEDPAVRGVGGYRVAGDLEARKIELEQQLVEARSQIREMDREVFAARKIVRRRRAASAVSRGGAGAALAGVIAFALLGAGVTASAALLLGVVVVGFVLGALIGMRWDSDDDFPDAPPPRTPYYGAKRAFESVACPR